MYQRLSYDDDFMVFVAAYDVYDRCDFNVFVEMVDGLCFSCRYGCDCVHSYHFDTHTQPSSSLFYQFL